MKTLIVLFAVLLALPAFGQRTLLSVQQGGTKDSTLGHYGVLLGNGTNPVRWVLPGTSGYVLTSNGSSAFPSWQAPPPSGVTSWNTRTGSVLPASGDYAVADITGLASALSAKANDNAVLHLAGIETVTGAKTFSALITGDISGNAGTVTNGVYTTGVGTVFLAPNGSAASLTGFPTLNQNTAGNAATATALQTARAINGVLFDGTAPITVTAAAGTLTGTTLNSTVTASSLTSVGTLANLTVTNPITGSVTGSAGSVAASAIAGATLASGVTGSSLTSLGTVVTGVWSATTVALNKGGTGATTQQTAIDALAGTQSNRTFLRSDGTHTTLSAIQAADVPTLNQNTTGTSANVTGVVALANGGTGSDLSATGGASRFLKQASVGAAVTVAQVTGADLSLSDVTTNNTSTAAHGFAPKLDNVSTHYLSGTGAWTTPSGGSMTNPMTTTGDVIYSSDGSGTPARLGIGSSGNTLTVVSGLPAWSGPNVLYSTTNPTSSVTGNTMYGLGLTFTPHTTGVVEIIASGRTSSVATCQLRYGTGAAPANGAAATGTQVGINGLSSTTPGTVIIAQVSGLAIGTTIWVDLALSSGTTVTLSSTMISIKEIK